MIKRIAGYGMLWLMLAACQSVVVEAPSRAQLAEEILRTSPTDAGADTCWATDVSPAIIETVTEQDLVTPEIRDAADQTTAPATFRSTSRQRILQDRGDIWFRAPCPAEMTPDFIATLQRALKARGLYLEPLTGVIDGPTTKAIRRYQVERGLDSGQLSLAAARELGILPTELDAL